MLFEIFVASVVELEDVTEIPVKEALADTLAWFTEILFGTVWLPIRLPVTVPMSTQPMVTSIPTKPPPWPAGTIIWIFWMVFPWMLVAAVDPTLTLIALITP